MQDASDSTGLGFLRSLQTALTHITLRVETERAAVKCAQEEVAAAKRRVDAQATVKTRGSLLDSAACVNWPLHPAAHVQSCDACGGVV